MTAPTLTPTEADRHWQSAWNRREDAKSIRNAYATLIADDTLRGWPVFPGVADDYLAHRAAFLEADADWDDARRLRARVRNAAMFEGRCA